MMSLTKKISRALEFDFSFSFKNVKKDYFGIQTGVTANAENLAGIQFSIVNFAKSGALLQLGAIGGADEFRGYQANLINTGLDCTDAIQMTLLGFNAAGEADTQLGPLNYCLHLDDGAQYGGLNLCMIKAEGSQTGGLNFSRRGYKLWQFGGLNIITKNPWYAKALPGMNYAFDMEKYNKKKEKNLEKEVTKIKETKQKEGNNGIVYARF